MFEFETYQYLILLVFLMAPITALTLIIKPIPNERFFPDGAGFTIRKPLADLIYKLPLLLGFILFYFQGESSASPVPLIFLICWVLYFFKSIFNTSIQEKRPIEDISLNSVLVGALLTTIVAYLNSKWISEYGVYNLDWLIDWRFIIGALLLLSSYFFNVQFSGDLLFSFGWALMTFSWGGLVFALYTLANLLPRILGISRIPRIPRIQESTGNLG